MSENPSRWAIVLAAGEGSRLSGLTTDANGSVVPKQFCSLRGGRSLLGDALARAARVVPRKRVVVVVAEKHRSFWSPLVRGVAAENVIAQPENRGTAAGVLLPLLHVLERAPDAHVVLLPSDHHVEREYVIEASLRLALDSLAEGDELGQDVTLLGIEPDAPETGFGWIVPATSERLVRPVARFVEKPGAREAADLMGRGAVWNSFLLAAEGRALLRLYERRLPGLLAGMRAAFDAPASERGARLASLYAELETRDFSRDLLQGSEAHLRLERVPACGWTDLGTPTRVAACLARLEEREPHPAEGRPRPSALRHDACLDLALSIRQALGRPLGGAALSV